VANVTKTQETGASVERVLGVLDEFRSLKA
jgi:hypothetical protein